MIKDVGRLGMWCVVNLAMTSCSLMPDRLPPPAVHDFGPVLATQHFTPADGSRVVVQSPEWLQDPRLRYRLLYRQPTRVQYYALDRWIAPPPDLLAQRLTVVAGHSGCRLEIELQAFEQLFPRPEEARVLIEFLALAIDPTSDPHRVLARKAFTLSRSSSSPDAAGAVDAFSHLVDDAVSRLDTWLRQLPEASRCASTFSTRTHASPPTDNPH